MVAMARQRATNAARASARANGDADVGLSGRHVRIGIRSAGEPITDPMDHVGGRRSDHARVTLTWVNPTLEVLADVAQVRRKDLCRRHGNRLVVSALDT